MKGVILAGGTGSRLFPATRAVCKQLLPVYDKPLIYYPLSTLLEAGIREICLISAPDTRDTFRRLLGSGADFGCRIRYLVQEKPEGIAQALAIAADFLAGAPCVLILGDNIFYPNPLIFPKNHSKSPVFALPENFCGAQIFLCRTENPQRFGVAQWDENGQLADVVEKPQIPPSAFAVTGIYLLDGRAADWAKTLRPSARGELEITDLQRKYLQHGQLAAVKLPQDAVWFDTGTPQSLLQAAVWVEKMQQKQGLLFSPEAAALRQGWISPEVLRRHAEKMSAAAYGRQLSAVLAE